MVKKGLGLKLAAVWFLLWGASNIFNLQFNGMNIVMGLLAIIAAVLILIDNG